MARNIAKSFATMTLVYWKPVVGGTGITYEQPVAFKGFYIGNARLDDGGVSDFVFSGGGSRENLVLFYMLEPEVDGYVSWQTSVAALEADGMAGTAPSEIPGTHRIKNVTTYVMPGTKSAALADKAFIASVA